MKRLALVCALTFTAAAVTAAHGDPKVSELQKQRAEAAERAFTQIWAQAKAGRGTLETVAVWSVRWMESVRDRTTDAKDRKQALVDHAARMAEVEAWATKAVSTGILGPAEAAAATYFRVEADLWVAAGKK